MKKKTYFELNRSYLSLLRALKPKSRTGLLKKASRGEINTLSEIADNTISGHVTQNPKLLNELKKFKALLRLIAKKSTPKQHKITLLTSKRGGTLLGLLLKAIGEFL